MTQPWSLVHISDHSKYLYLKHMFQIHVAYTVSPTPMSNPTSSPTE